MEALRILQFMKLSLMTQISGQSFTRPLVYALTVAHGLQFLATAGSTLLWKKANLNRRWIALQKFMALLVTKITSFIVV